MKAEHRLQVQTLKEAGFGVVSPDQYLIDMEPEFRRIWETVAPCTMTSIERGYAVYKGVEYIVSAGIPGDFVECGVWKGGSCMLVAEALKLFAPHDVRHIWLYDTFTGMPAPTPEDVIAWNGRQVSEKWEADQRGEGQNFTSWSVGMNLVRKNMEKTGYPQELMHFIPGKVEDTLPEFCPLEIALLRLDTDWYESTRRELECMYPVVSRGGILIIDDYGHFLGARKAVDEYFKAKPVFLSRLDYTGRILVKP